MNTNILKSVNRHIKKQRPMFPDDKICSVFSNNYLVELGFLSKACRNDLSGTCIMCDYGATKQTYTVDQYLAEMDDILNTIPENIQRLLLCTNGSFLDDHQISSELFEAILKKAADSPIPYVEMETHYLDVNKKKLDTIKKILGSKFVTIEMGLETTNQTYQDLIIMKHIKLDVFEQTINLIQDYGFQVDLNIMFGLPFMSPQEQIKDAQKSIIWSHNHGCHSVVFPVNIKPYTLLWHMYQTKFYTPFSNWLFLLLLDSMSAELLSDITLAWYGNREENYGIDCDRTVFPQNCADCESDTKLFYEHFMEDYDGHKRKLLLKEFLSSSHCNCLNNVREHIQMNGDMTFEFVYNLYTDLLKKEYANLFDIKEL